MSRLLYELGLFSVRHRRSVLVVWLLVAAGIFILGRVSGGESVDDFSVPGVESQAAADLLEERFPERAGATAMVVFEMAEGSVADASNAGTVARTVEAIAEMDHVLGITDPLGASSAMPRSVSQDGTVAVAAVQFDSEASALGHDVLDDLVATASDAGTEGVQVEVGGELPTVLKERHTGKSEAIGMVAAVVILLITFTSFVAMGTTLVTAVVGLVVGLSLVGVLGAFVDIPSVATRLGTMIGLGVGIDYALFVVSRARENLEAGMSVEEGVGRTSATAGQAVAFAGGTVVVAILGLQAAGIPFVAALGWSAALVVAVAVLVALTLLPALLGFAGPRILGRLFRKGTDDEPSRAGRTHTSRWARWSAHVVRHPWRYLLSGTLVLVVLAVPMFSLRLGQADAGNDPTDTTPRRAYDIVAGAFGAGFNGPLRLVIDLEDSGADPESLAADLTRSLAAEPGVEAVTPPETNPARDTIVLTVIPNTKPQAEETTDLVHHLRNEVLPELTADSGARVLVGGPTAAFIDQADRITERLPWFIAAVVLVSFVLLTLVFRSLLVPLKAALLNLLAIGAAYGVVVAVFQWGWGASLVGVGESLPIASFVPMMMFAILFGLSMDYEVFILSRIREEHSRTGDSPRSIVDGLASTARVVSAAALIMVSVFLGFVTGSDPIVKMMGIGLAAAVALDATIVRMVLVPATMALMGEANWWLPRWLDRILPRLDLEGSEDLPRTDVRSTATCGILSEPNGPPRIGSDSDGEEADQDAATRGIRRSERPSHAPRV